MMYLRNTTIRFLLCAALFCPGASMAATKYYTEDDIVILPVYLAAAPFSEGLAVVRDNRGTYYITLDGRRAFGRKVFDMAASFQEGLAAVQINGKVGYINNKGAIAIQPQFEDGLGFSNGKALVWLDRRGSWAFINTEGKIIATLGEANANTWSGPSFNSLDGKPEFVEGRALFSVREAGWPQSYCGYMDESGEYVIPPRYKEAKPFSEGLAAVQLDVRKLDDWTFIDRNGNIAIPRHFYQAMSFQDGVALVWTDTIQQEYINTRGETVFVLPPEANVYRYGDDFELMVCIGHNQCGIQDTKGNWIINPVFPMIFPFSEGLAIIAATYTKEAPWWLGLRGPSVHLERTGTGVINRNGEIVVPKGMCRYMVSI